MAEPDMTRDARDVAPDGEALGEPGEILRVPEVEEHLRVERRRVALGFVEVRKRVVTEQVMVPVELRREVVEYRLIDDPGGAATVPEPPGDLKDDTVRIPVFREKPVVHKEVVVASEVVIDRRLITERRTLDDTLRRATVTVSDDLDGPEHAAAPGPEQRHPDAGGAFRPSRDDGEYPVHQSTVGEEDHRATARRTDARRHT